MDGWGIGTSFAAVAAPDMLFEDVVQAGLIGEAGQECCISLIIVKECW
jgi:hypothetical protein